MMVIIDSIHVMRLALLLGEACQLLKECGPLTSLSMEARHTLLRNSVGRVAETLPDTGIKDLEQVSSYLLNSIRRTPSNGYEEETEARNEARKGSQAEVLGTESRGGSEESYEGDCQRIAEAFHSEKSKEGEEGGRGPQAEGENEGEGEEVREPAKGEGEKAKIQSYNEAVIQQAEQARQTIYEASGEILNEGRISRRLFEIRYLANSLGPIAIALRRFSKECESSTSKAAREEG